MKPTKETFKEWNEEMYNKEKNLVWYKGVLGYFCRKRMKYMLKFANVKFGEDLLDLGCGDGVLLNMVGIDKFVGVDLSETAIKTAKNNTSSGEFINGNAEDIRLKRKFDVIICSEVLEHTLNPEKVIETIKIHSKPTTRIIISVPNEKLIRSFKELTKKSWIIRKTLRFSPHINEWHLHSFDLKMLESLLVDKEHIRYGFIIKRIKRIPFWFLPADYVVELKCVE